MLRITLKVAPRTSRPFEIPFSEEEFGDLRRRYWTGRKKEDATDESFASELSKNALAAMYPGSSRQIEVVVAKAITSLSLWVGGIYWYHDRTPPSSQHTRVRAFFADDGTLVCPKCKYQLCDDFNEYTEAPVEFSKTLNNPRFICPHCNSYVQVSQKTQVYKDAQEQAREERKKKTEPTPE